MKVQDAARSYIASGWQVVPLREKSKKCVDDKNWLAKVYTPADFKPTHNIGIKSTGGLIDLDCDCNEAVYLAAALLPKTTAVYGRQSRPRSHYLYLCPTIKKPFAFKDLILKTTLLEVRVNHQTMAPPSIHPDGEVIEWAYDDPKLTDPEDKLVLRRAMLISTGSMVIRYYNPPGARHDWGMALAGFMRHLSIKEVEAAKLFELAGLRVSDGDIKDRLDSVRSTYSTAEDEPATGRRRLIELIGGHGLEFCNTLNKIWGEAAGGIPASKMAVLNKRHAVVQRQGGKVRIMTEAHERGHLQIRWTSRAEFAIMYPKKFQVGVSTSGKPITKCLAEAWIENDKRRTYTGIELAPDGDLSPGYYNLWQGFAVEPKQGDWGLYRDHLRLLVKHDEDHLQYVIAWLADCVQNPAKPAGIALSIRGKQGTGKSTAAKWFGALFGQHFLHLDSEHRLLGQFNSHLHNAIVVLADEAMWAGGHKGLGALKRMITEDTLAIEPKGLDIINVRNMLHMIVASNEDWFVPATWDNRRFAIFEVSDARQNDGAFFGAVHEQLFKQEGLAALLYDLLELKTDIDLRKIPDTEEAERQKRHTMNAKEEWWYEQLQSGDPWVEGDELTRVEGLRELWEVDPGPIYEVYCTQVARADRRVNPGLWASLSRFLNTMMPDGYPDTTRKVAGKRVWRIPNLEECRSFFDKKTGYKTKWPKEVGGETRDVPF